MPTWIILAVLPLIIIDDHGELVMKTSVPDSKLPRGPPRGRASIISISPAGGHLEGNITVLVRGAAFHNWGACTILILLICACACAALSSHSHLATGAAGDVRCRFCSVEVPGTVVHEDAIACVAPRATRLVAREVPTRSISSLRACTVDITLNGEDFTGTSGSIFTYYDSSLISLVSIRPSGGPLQGGTAVNVTGTAFHDYGGGIHGPRCRFGNAVTLATIVSSQLAHCASPPYAIPSNVTVQLTLNGYTDARGLSPRGRLTFMYTQPATLNTIHPWGGPVLGRKAVVVYGTGFVDQSGITAECAADDDVFCTLHQVAAGVQRASDAHDGLSCHFVGQGLWVTTPATNNGNTTRLTCQSPLGEDLLRLAQPIGPWCAHLGHTPQCNDRGYASAGVRVVTLHVSLNGDVASTSLSNGLAYMLFSNILPRIQSAVPWGGPVTGGTEVSIIGEGLLAFAAQPLCRFGHLEVPAVVGGIDGTALDTLPLSSLVELHDDRTMRVVTSRAGRLIRCVSPPGHAMLRGDVDLSVSLNGQDYMATTLRWTWTTAAHTTSNASPVGGPVNGGTHVVVSGSEFRRLGDLQCLFGDQAVPATLPEAVQQLRCVSPPVPVSGRVALRVILNGISPSNTSIDFIYFDDNNVQISSLKPASGPIFGGTAVTIYGTGLAAHGTVMCRFGTSEPVNAWLTERESSTRDLRLFVCVSPPYEIGRAHV